MKNILDKDYIIHKTLEEKIFISEDEIEIILAGVILIYKINDNLNIFIKDDL